MPGASLWFLSLVRHKHLFDGRTSTEIFTIVSDTPYALALSALEAIPVLAGTSKTGFDFTVYTGDLVSHDPDNQLSRAYIEYAEVKITGWPSDLLKNNTDFKISDCAV